MLSSLKELATAVVAVAEPDTTAQVAAQLMRQHHVGALVVVDAAEKTRPVGIVTDRDLVLAVMAEGLDAALFTVGDIMSTTLLTAPPDMGALEAVALMKLNRVHRLVVVDEAGRLIGIASVDDLLSRISLGLGHVAATLRGARDREFEQRA